MPISGTDGTPDITLELGGGGVGHIPKVDLISQFREGDQERLDGSVGTGSGDILEFAASRWWYVSRKATTYRNDEGGDTREDVGATTPCLPADGTTPIVTRTTQCVSVSRGADPGENENKPNANGFPCNLSVC